MKRPIHLEVLHVDALLNSEREGSFIDVASLRFQQNKCAPEHI